MSVRAEQNAKLKELLPTEQSLCALFLREFNAIEGWTCYPETGGFDIVVAHESGRQIGVEAKLQLNAKVADQILPSDSEQRYREVGPDHRLVIVRSITEANAGIAKMLDQLGVMVWDARMTCRGVGGWEGESFQIDHKLLADDHSTEHRFGWFAWPDWNPVERLQLPEIAPNLPAGVAAPVQLTPWKQNALRVLATLRTKGTITAKEIASLGCSPSMWTQQWLDRGPVRGQWVESDRLPRFDEQHPDIYAVVLAKVVAS